MKINKIVAFIMSLFFVVGLCGCSHVQEHDIYILYTNDVHCNIDGENIGYAGVKALRNEYANNHTYVSLVDCGDSVEGNAYGEYREGYEIIMLMNDCEYDVAAFGNQDFDYGVQRVKEMAEQANFPIVCCNMDYIGKGTNPLKGIEPYVIKKYGHTKVAFIGVMTPDILTEGKPAYEALLEDGELAYHFCEGNDGQDLYDRVQKTVDKVRKKVDYVILLSHLGIETKSEPYTSFEVIANTSGIDVVIDAHSHTVMHGEIVENKNGEGVVITSTGKELENVGVLILTTDHNYSTTLYPYVHEKDPFVEAEVNDVKEAVNKR